MTSRTWRVAAFMAKALLATLRAALYVTLLVVGRVLRPLLGLATAFGVIVLVGGLLFWREHPEMLIAG